MIFPGKVLLLHNHLHLRCPVNRLHYKKSVNNAMKELLFTGDFERIYSKWFLARVPPDNALIHMSMPSQLKQDILKYNSEYPALHAK